MGRPYWVSLLKKSALPLSVRLFSVPGLRKIPYCLEVVGSSLQSKRGGGTDSEWREVTNARRFIHSSDPLIFDVGANTGRWTSAMLRQYFGKSKPRVIMFEPQAQCWPELEKIIDPRVTLVKSALSDHDGALTFFHGNMDETESASAHEQLGFSGIKKKIEVPCLRLDSYLRSISVNHVDFVKMDIEGHEIQAIEGANESLAQGLIRAISFEFGNANVNSRTFFIDFFERFTAYKYAIYRLGHDGIPIQISSYARSMEYFDGVANYVAAMEPPNRYRVDTLAF